MNMEQDGELLSATATRLARAEREHIDSHPTAARMQAYLEGTLALAEQSELQEHLSVCVSCTQDLLQLKDFLFRGVAEADLSEAWELWPSVRLRLVTAGVLSRTSKARHAGGRVSWTASWLPLPVSWALGGLSVVLLMTTLYFGLQVRAYRSPRINTVVADLIPVTASPALRGNTDPQYVSLSEQTDRILVMLNVSSTSSYSSYELEIREGREATGKLVWATKTRGRTRSGNFNVDLDKSFLTEGPYSIRVFGLSDGQREVLGDYYLYIKHEY